MEALRKLEPDDPRKVGGYRIVARLGAGGMGRVYLGRSPGGRAVAVKVVRPELAEDREFRQRFAREVAAARRVGGVFTAGVVDADPEASPPWLATAYVPGAPLDVAVARHGAWPEASVLVLAAGLAEALGAIHGAGLVHRDLKPSNVLLAADGPRVIDFGISVAADASALTRTGIVVGTPGFMSPEQLTGAPVGPASDVFSLGAVLAFTASGAGPFGTGSAQALMFRVVHEEPNLAGLPPRLRSLAARCLDKRPEGRPEVETLLAELAETVGSEQVTVLFTGSEWLPSTVAESVRRRAEDMAAEADAEGEKPTTPATPPPTTPTTPIPPPYWASSAPPHMQWPQSGHGAVGIPASSGRKRTRTMLVAMLAVLVVLAVGVAGWRVAAHLGSQQETPTSGSESGTSGGSSDGEESGTSGGSSDGEESGTSGKSSDGQEFGAQDSGAPVVGTWTGTYTCTQGLAGMALAIKEFEEDGERFLRAVLSFYPVPSNPGVAEGMYEMTGSYEDGVLVLFGSEWIERPSGYVMADLTAFYDSQEPDHIEGSVVNIDRDGNITDVGCTGFSVDRDS